MRQPRFPYRTLGVIGAMAVCGILITWAVFSGVGQGQQTTIDTVDDAEAIRQANSLSRAFRSAAKKVIPTVVKVKTKTKADPSQTNRSLRSENPFRGTPWEDFFDDDLNGSRRFQVPNVPTPGLGCGVIIDPSGIVLTNNHVVAHADEVIIQLDDGREFPATDIKTDERTDLAVLRIDAGQPLPAAKLGDSDQLEIGDWVIAVGNPFHLEQTVSAGIISAKGRSLEGVRRARFLQTDAAINPGNSGGPLVNLNGEVIGINTAIFSQTGGYQGIGFAIPANLAKWVTTQLIKRGTVARAYLGVSMTEITADDSERLGIGRDAGVVVKLVGDESPAGKAGIAVDDVIASFDDRPIRTTGQLQELVERLPPGSRHNVGIIRDGKSRTLEVAIETMPEDFETTMSGPRIGTSEFHRDRQTGLMVLELTDAMAEQLGYEKSSGVLIMHVDRGQIAEQAGLRQGMLITKVGGKPIKSVEEFKTAIEEQSLADGIKLEITTRSGSKTVTLQRS